MSWLRPENRSANATLPPPGACEDVVLVDLDPRQLAALLTQLVAQPAVNSFSFAKVRLARRQPLSCETTL
jgi:hypothetical protein